MKLFRIALFGLACLLWPNFQSAQAAPPDAVSIGTATTMDVSSLSTGAVRVEIVEGVPDQTSWDYPMVWMTEVEKFVDDRRKQWAAGVDFGTSKS